MSALNPRRCLPGPTLLSWASACLLKASYTTADMVMSRCLNFRLPFLFLPLFLLLTLLHHVLVLRLQISAGLDCERVGPSEGEGGPALWAKLIACYLTGRNPPHPPRHPDTQTPKHSNITRDRHTETETETDRLTDRETDRPRDGETERPTDRQTETETETETETDTERRRDRQTERQAQRHGQRQRQPPHKRRLRHLKPQRP